MWVSNKKLKHEIKEIYNYLKRLRKRLEELELDFKHRKRDAEKEEGKTKKCPKGCTDVVYHEWSGWDKPSIRLKLVGNFLICKKCGYTEPYKDPKYNFMTDIGFGLEDLEEKVDKLLKKKKKKKKK